MYHINPPDIESRAGATLVTDPTTAHDMQRLAGDGWVPVKTKVLRGHGVRVVWAREEAAKKALAL